MLDKIKIRDKTISEQVSSMRSRYPHFNTQYTSQNTLKVSGQLRPTSRSITYNFILKYNLINKPQTKIISPKLYKNIKDEAIPHLYPGENLCLYRPKYHGFSRTDFLCDTIIPWTSLWLYYYEVWHVTGNWLGGGEHPNIITTQKDEKKR